MHNIQPRGGRLCESVTFPHDGQKHLKRNVCAGARKAKLARVRQHSRSVGGALLLAEHILETCEVSTSACKHNWRVTVGGNACVYFG